MNTLKFTCILDAENTQPIDIDIFIHLSEPL